MKAAAKQLEFERAAALRDEIQQIRLRVLEQDASVIVARAAERAAKDAALPAKERAAAHRPGGARAGRGRAGVRGHRGHGARSRARSRADVGRRPTVGIAAELFPGIRDEHEDEDGGWQARWLDRPTWDRTRHAEHPPPDRAAPAARARGY